MPCVLFLRLNIDKQAFLRYIFVSEQMFAYRKKKHLGHLYYQVSILV